MNGFQGVETIRKVVADGGGYSSSEVNSQLQIALMAIRRDLSHGSKLSEVENWLGVYFSEHKWKKWPGGLDQIRSWIQIDLGVILRDLGE